MKHLFSVLVLMLALVLALGSSTWAGVLPGEDYDDPSDGPNEDHPWGGDLVSGGTSGDKFIRSSSLTGIVMLDLFINQIFGYVEREDKSIISTRRSSYNCEKRDYRSDDRLALRSVNSGQKYWRVER